MFNFEKFKEDIVVFSLIYSKEAVKEYMEHIEDFD